MTYSFLTPPFAPIPPQIPQEAEDLIANIIGILAARQHDDGVDLSKEIELLQSFYKQVPSGVRLTDEQCRKIRQWFTVDGQHSIEDANAYIRRIVAGEETQ